MVYQRVSKPSSENSQIHQQDSPSTAHKILVQAKSDSAPPQEQEMPSYTPLAANWATNNNLIRSLSASPVVQRQEESGEEEMEPIQAKLTIGQVGDKYEQEADETAQRVVNQINTPVPQQTSQGQSLQRKEQYPTTVTPLASVGDRVIQAKGDMTGTRQDSSVKQHPNQTGLPDGLKATIESLSGISMDNVNVHYNSSQPAQLNALAYAQGNDIHVASGQEKHLPHEAWHVVQQAQGRVKPTMQKKDGVLVNQDEGLENEADVMGAQALTNAAQLQRAPEEQELLRGQFTPLRCNSLGKDNRAVPAEVAQMKEPRSKNPHNPQTGVTSHHIIPHELLGKILDKFTGEGEKDEITRDFLPDFDNLTLSNFVAQVAVGVEYDGASPNKVTDLPEEVATKAFGQMTGEEQGKTRFKVEDAGKISFDQFKTLYGQLKRGEAVENDKGEAVSGLRDLGDSFFEWQGGNLFYGPERIEPGAKDGFDYDAKLIYGESFTRQLQAIYTQLRSLEGKDDAVSKLEMRKALGAMAALTKGTGVPKYDPNLWIAMDSAAKKSVHDALLPERGQTSKEGLSIHRQVLEEAIKKYSNDKTRAHKILSFTKKEPEDMSQESVFGANRKLMWLKDATTFQVALTTLKTIEDVKQAMKDTLTTFFRS
ncbi:eCIS core domain-containing protein [Allocoleopsis franciscana]|uniref:eCIS core domain-containing protein n=1 Tax=Allocoleopsis franciscana PCC 7113 TaxID=1173027 RepID=K9WD59_9CYAN|nr:DUF4157 domain-containing protein [Allocoleopsis franciscana]AFZ18148.1 hypothetical protein Mic7113_2343 [Allocoleopsis franciscana PCC 7113]